jgi:hypothetical protein
MGSLIALFRGCAVALSRSFMVVGSICMCIFWHLIDSFSRRNFRRVTGAVVHEGAHSIPPGFDSGSAAGLAVRPFLQAELAIEARKNGGRKASTDRAKGASAVFSQRRFGCLRLETQQTYNADSVERAQFILAAST